jgi:hypothetical protein
VKDLAKHTPSLLPNESSHKERWVRFAALQPAIGLLHHHFGFDDLGDDLGIGFALGEFHDLAGEPV